MAAPPTMGGCKPPATSRTPISLSVSSQEDEDMLSVEIEREETNNRELQLEIYNLNEKPQLKSFKDALGNSSQKEGATGRNGVNVEDHATIDFEDDGLEDPEEIKMQISEDGVDFHSKDSVIDRWAESWKHSIVITVFNRFVGYQVLKEKVRRLWNLNNNFEMLDLENNYFLIRFANEKDWEHVLMGGPWMVFGSYLVIQPWSPGFDVEDSQTAALTVWVRIPRLPVHFYKRRFLEAIGNVLGKTIRIDYNTMKASRAKFAQMAIQLNLKKPLVDRFKVNGRGYKVEYEGFSEICFKCGRMGYIKEKCNVVFDSKGKEIERQTEEPTDTQPKTIPVQTDNKKGRGGISKEGSVRGGPLRGGPSIGANLKALDVT